MILINVTIILMVVCDAITYIYFPVKIFYLFFLFNQVSLCIIRISLVLFTRICMSYEFFRKVVGREEITSLQGKGLAKVHAPGVAFARMVLSEEASVVKWYSSRSIHKPFVNVYCNQIWCVNA